jgi:large subunit ribosomal protein L13
MAYVIDATGKSLGRIATEAATVLMGKHTPAFAKNKVGGEETKIVNASKLRVSGTKADTKIYSRYTGYPGGLRQETFQELVNRSGTREALRKAIYGMLPGNRLRPHRMKLLTIEE